MLHTDGTECPEGTQQVPDNFIPCCSNFDSHTKNCYLDLRIEWWETNHIWAIPLDPTAGGGGININYCPWCGTVLNKMALT